MIDGGNMRVVGSTLMLAAFAVIFAQGIIGQTPVQGCSLKDYKIVPDFEQIKAGEIVELEIVSKNGDKIEGEFKWSVSIGKIISGQGASEIQVRTPANALINQRKQRVKNQTTKLPPSDKNGWIFIGAIGRRTVPLKVTVHPVRGSDCNGQELSTVVSIGKSSIESFTNYSANVTDLILGKTGFVASCGTSASDENAIDISVKAEDRENDVLTYDYKVSAGKIIGTGANVKWDLSGVAPGVYSITAGVDDGCGVCGKTITKTVTIAKCF